MGELDKDSDEVELTLTGAGIDINYLYGAMQHGGHLNPARCDGNFNEETIRVSGYHIRWASTLEN